MMIALFIAVALATGIAADYWYGLPEDATATYVGRQSCIECHQQEAKAWSGSHHDLAMDLATSETVLASFNNEELQHHGVSSRMFQKDGKYFVHTDGPDGKLADFEVKYVFGVTPLQQYMVEFDRPADMPEEEISRVQVLRETWDTKKKKWFYQNPPDVEERLESDDELHWTGVTQRWNTSCADCHSTNLKRNFDLDSRTYHTTFSEMDVSCEACHGPGSLHVQLAKSRSLFWDRNRGYALAKLKGESNLAQVEACAPCHSVRSPIHGDYAAGERLHDFYATELLRNQIYHPDGQILGEDYEYGSFTQSKMFHKNVRCSDCHNPHSLQLKHEGNQLCTSCHTAHPAGKFDSPNHHNHKVGSKGASCVECHMPATTYMDVDPRRDHSLRIPRPDLSIKLGTPNACVACHIADSKLPVDKRPKSPSPNRPAEYADWLREGSQGNTAVKAELDRLNRWADAAAEKWYGEKRKKEPHFAETLLAAREMRPEAKSKLIDLLGNKTQPAIARATAAMELGMFVDPDPNFTADAIAALREALQDKNASVRAAAIDSLQIGPPEDLQKLFLPLLSDPSRMVRFRAVQGLSGFGRNDFLGADYRKFSEVGQEFLAAAKLNSDRAGQHLMLGGFAERQGSPRTAQQEYQLALLLEPTIFGPRSNLAAAMEQEAEEMNRELSTKPAGEPSEFMDRVEKFTRENIQQSLQIAARLRQQELDLLERDVRRLPENAELQRRVGLLRHLHGWRKGAESALLQAVLLEPRNPAMLEYLAIYYSDTGRPKEALPLVERILRLKPKHPRYEELRKEILTKDGDQP
ncbi:MAG: HEAT repeat domain-containing protein [Pirellulaceae bacterium]